MGVKVWYHSKTVWLGLVMLLGGLMNQFGWVELPMVADAGWVDSVLGVVLIALRAVTSEPIEWK